MSELTDWLRLTWDESDIRRLLEAADRLDVLEAEVARLTEGPHLCHPYGTP